MTSTADSILDEVLSERMRQINRHGFTPASDDAHPPGALLRAAVNYLAAACWASARGEGGFYGPPPFPLIAGEALTWGWHPAWWKPSSVRRMLIKVMALCAAEVERIDRAAEARR